MLRKLRVAEIGDSFTGRILMPESAGKRLSKSVGHFLLQCVFFKTSFFKILGGSFPKNMPLHYQPQCNAADTFQPFVAMVICIDSPSGQLQA